VRLIIIVVIVVIIIVIIVVVIIERPVSSPFLDHQTYRDAR